MKGFLELPSPARPGTGYVALWFSCWSAVDGISDLTGSGDQGSLCQLLSSSGHVGHVAAEDVEYGPYAIVGDQTGDRGVTLRDQGSEDGASGSPVVPACVAMALARPK
ncbi:hypothetical protein GCM10027569_87570 [Flindersiella endophytica]